MTQIACTGMYMSVSRAFVYTHFSLGESFAAILQSFPAIATS